MSELLDVINPLVLKICRAIAGARGDDAAQEVLTIVFRHLDRLAEPAALSGWVRTIAVREAARQVRARDRAGIPLADPAEAAPSHDDLTLRVALIDQLKRLPDQQRAVLILRDFEGLSEREAADMLGIATGTVKSRLNRARARFRAGWTE